MQNRLQQSRQCCEWQCYSRVYRVPANRMSDTLQPRNIGPGTSPVEGPLRKLTSSPQEHQSDRRTAEERFTNVLSDDV